MTRGTIMIVLVFLVFVVILLVVAFGAPAARSGRQRPAGPPRGRRRDASFTEDLNPDHLPDSSSPTESDDL